MDPRIKSGEVMTWEATFSGKASARVRQGTYRCTPSIEVSPPSMGSTVPVM